MAKSDTPTDIAFNFDTFKAEAERKPFPIVIRGERVELPPAAEYSGIEFFENALKGDAYTTLQILKDLLTKDQYEALREDASIDKIKAFFDKYLADSGMKNSEGNA